MSELGSNIPSWIACKYWMMLKKCFLQTLPLIVQTVFSLLCLPKKIFSKKTPPWPKKRWVRDFLTDDFSYDENGIDKRDTMMCEFVLGNDHQWPGGGLVALQWWRWHSFGNAVRQLVIAMHGAVRYGVSGFVRGKPIPWSLVQLYGKVLGWMVEESVILRGKRRAGAIASQWKPAHWSTQRPLPGSDEEGWGALSTWGGLRFWGLPLSTGSVSLWPAICTLCTLFTAHPFSSSTHQTPSQPSCRADN